MNAQDFINSVATGNSSEAKETLTDLLSSRAFDALSSRKIEIAQSLFGGYQVEEEVELTQEEFDQLDELSKATVKGYLKGSKKENDPRVHGDSAGPANQMSAKARSLGRTEQDKEDSRYEGNKRAIAKLGGSNSVLASKVPAK
jgi:hypothetical protein